MNFNSNAIVQYFITSTVTILVGSVRAYFFRSSEIDNSPLITNP